jgi:hypothetical protein
MRLPRRGPRSSRGQGLSTTERAGAHSLQFGTYALWTAELLAALAVRPVPSCAGSLTRGVNDRRAKYAQVRRAVVALAGDDAWPLTRPAARCLESSLARPTGGAAFDCGCVPSRSDRPWKECVSAVTWRALCAAVSAGAPARLDQDSCENALLSRPWCAWPSGSGPAGEQPMVSRRRPRRQRWGELPGAGAARRPRSVS